MALIDNQYLEFSLEKEKVDQKHWASLELNIKSMSLVGSCRLDHKRGTLTVHPQLSQLAAHKRAEALRELHKTVQDTIQHRATTPRGGKKKAKATA